MLTWPKIALAVLQIAAALLEFVKRKQQFDEGYQAAVLETTKSVMILTDKGKKLWDKIDALSDAELDDVERDLGAS